MMTRVSDFMTIKLTSKDLKRIGRIGGWAPGSYAGKCADCDGEIIGDKRAVRCFVCAVVSVNAETSDTVTK